MLRRGMHLALLFVAMLLGACATNTNRAMTSHADPLSCQPIPGNTSHERLCVQITRDRGDLWFVSASGGHRQRRLIEGLSFVGGDNGPVSFGDFSISPSGTYLAATIAEEGHPTLLFRSLPQALQGQAESGDLPAISIYPGGISSEGWQSDNQLIVSSDQNLAHYRHGDELGESRNYLVHLPDGKVTSQTMPPNASR